MGFGGLRRAEVKLDVRYSLRKSVSMLSKHQIPPEFTPPQARRASGIFDNLHWVCKATVYLGPHRAKYFRRFTASIVF